MAGFSGAVEDGVRGIGMVVSLVAAVVASRVFRSVTAGIVVFVIGNAVALVWANLAGDDFRARQFQDTTRADTADEDEPES